MEEVRETSGTGSRAGNESKRSAGWPIGSEKADRALCSPGTVVCISRSLFAAVSAGRGILNSTPAAVGATV